jgi:hypothetical protein
MAVAEPPVGELLGDALFAASGRTELTRPSFRGSDGVLFRFARRPDSRGSSGQGITISGLDFSIRPFTLARMEPSR